MIRGGGGGRGELAAAAVKRFVLVPVFPVLLL